MATIREKSAARVAIRRRAWRFTQVAVTLGAFLYLFYGTHNGKRIVDLPSLIEALSRVPLSAFALAVCLTGAAYGLAVLRWHSLLVAFGAVALPPLSRLTRYYLIGAFYNTYLPGGLGGDVVRALASRSAFGERGTTSALASVFVERVVGLTALLLVTATATLVHPLPGTQTAWLPSWALGSIALLLSSAVVLGLLLARRLSTIAPKPIAKWLERLPVPERWTPLFVTLPISVLCQLLPALAGYVLISALLPHASLLDSLVVVPLAMAATFLPITLSGAGVRETIFVSLYATVGVPSSLALAASLILWLAQATIAAIGGGLVLLRPVGEPASDT